MLEGTEKVLGKEHADALMGGYCLAYLVNFQDWLLFPARLVAFPPRTGCESSLS
jgi:hypothetical protein